MDLLAVALPVVILVLLAIALVATVSRSSLRWLFVFGSLALFFLASVIGPWRPQSAPEPDESIRIATVNTGLYWFSDNDVGFLIETQRPELVVGVELAESHDAELRRRFTNATSDILPLARQQQNEEGLEPIGDTYRRNGLPSIGVYSDLEIEILEDPVADEIDGGLPGFRVRVEAPSGPIIVYALHIPRPIGGDGPYELPVGEHLDMVEAITNAVAAESLPTVVVGDLNTVDRGQGYRTLTSVLEDGMRQNAWAVPTADRPLPFSLLFARIDHLLVTSDVCVANAASIDTRFADHRPLVADIGPCPRT